MSDDSPNLPEPAGAPLPPKPALAPGVRSRFTVSNATRASGPGAAPAPLGFSPGLKPSLAAPKPRLHTIEDSPAPAAATYKVSLVETTQSSEAIPVSHVIGSGLAAAVALVTAFLTFLKY